MDHEAITESVEAYVTKTGQIMSMGVPRSKNHCSFLMFVSLHGCFIRGFSKIAAPLQSLVSGKVPYCCRQQAGEELKSPKRALCLPPVLDFLNAKKQIVSFVNACQAAIGVEYV